MGYIFDALKKQHDTEPQAITPDADVSDALTPDADITAEAENTALPTGGLIADAMQVADQSQEDPAPLRLADAPLAYQAVEPEETPIAFEQSTIQEPGAIETQDDYEDAAPLALAKPASRGGWWSRLFGKYVRGPIDDRLVSMTSPASAVAEEYRSIRTSILARHENDRHLVHTITSATPQEGKTITCVNLGLSFAELRNRKTIIVECDMRLPTFAKLTSCDTDKPGLIDYLRGDAKLKDIIQQIDGSPMHILPAGGRVSDEAVQLLSSTRMSQLIQAMRAKYDHVLIDTPPVLQLADAGILGAQSEEVLLVARMRRTPRTLVEQAVNTLTSYNATVNGIIATDNPRNRARGYGYKYGYRYGYGYGYGYGYTSEHDGKRRKRRDAA